MSSDQPSERLIRLEDEELDTTEDFNEDAYITDEDSCKVPMIPNGNQVDSIDTKLKQIRTSG